MTKCFACPMTVGRCWAEPAHRRRVCELIAMGREDYRQLVIDRSLHGDPEPQPEHAVEPALPSLLTQATSFAGALARHIAGGAQEATATEQARRREICLACDRYRASDGRCAECGCFVAAKTAWLRERCPLNKW